MRRLLACAGVGIVGVLLASAPAQAALPPCSAAYSQTVLSALRLEALTPQVAYGRRVDFAVGGNADSLSTPQFTQYLRKSEGEAATLTLQGSRPGSKPYVDSEAEMEGEKYFVQPERSEGTSETVSVAYDESYVDPEGKFGPASATSEQKCRRTLTATVQFVKGRRPTVAESDHGGTVKFKVKTYGESCSLTLPGRLLFVVHGPESTHKLTLSDPCTGHWSGGFTGNAWSLSGGLPASRGLEGTGEEAELEVSSYSHIPGRHHFSVVSYFRGRPFQRTSWDAVARAVG